MNQNNPHKILAITLARGGSKSVPRKNVALIAGAPLIAYTIEQTIHSKLITRYLVSTDDPGIQKVAVAYGAEAPFLRPAELSDDTAPSHTALQHAVAWAEAQEKGRPYDYVIELMCTNPFKTTQDMDGVLTKLIETGADSVISVVKLEDHHPARIKKIVDDRLVDFCVPEVINSRRQDLKPDAYVRNGSIYAMTRKSLMIDNARYGTADSRPYVMPADRSVNVDTPLDFMIAEILMKRHPMQKIRPLSEVMP